MRLLRQNQEKMDSETYAKELTSEQYDRTMSPMKQLYSKGSSGLRSFLSEYQTVDGRKENQE